MPAAKRLGIMFNPDNPIQGAPLAQAVASAQAALATVDIERVATRSLAEMESAIDSRAGRRTEAVVFVEEPMQLVNATGSRPLSPRSIGSATAGPLEFAPAGAMIAYGVHFREIFRRAAVFVDKILKGAKPARPAGPAGRRRFEFVINLKTAEALGLSIPARSVQRADRVFE